MEAHRSYARAIAAEAAHKCGSWIERSELESAADLGLVEAANAFDPTRGVLFTTFSYYRIRGAVYDYLRKVGMRPSIFEVAANEYLKDVSTGMPGGSPGPGMRGDPQHRRQPGDLPFAVARSHYAADRG